MKTSTIVQIILNSIIITLFLGSGITVLLLRHFANGYDKYLLGTTLIVSGTAKLIIYYLNKGHKNPRNITIISSGVMIALGALFFISNRDMEMLCFGWGVTEIVLGLIEVYIDLLEVKEDKIAILELVVNATTIVFGALLCINLSNGLTVHLIFLGISLILLAIIAFLKLIRKLKGQPEDEEKHNS